MASLVISDSISRNIEGVLGNSSSLEEESFEEILLEAPSYTKPNIFNKMAIPKEFLKGNHAKIHSLKLTLSKNKTRFHRPDLYKKWIVKEKDKK